MAASETNGSGSSPAQASAEPRRKGRKRRRWPWVLLGLLVVLLMLVALAPTLASTGPARRLVVSKVNEQLNGELSIESWSLGWFSGVRLDGVRVVDTEGQPAVEVESVVLPASVPALLGSSKRLGTIRVTRPKVHAVLYEDGSLNLAKLAKPGPEPPEPSEPQPLGFDVTGELIIEDGEIVVQTAADPKPLTLRDLDVHVIINGINEPIGLKLTAAVGEERARLEADGSATVMKDGLPAPKALQATLALHVEPVDLAPVERLARQLGVPVTFAGQVGAKLAAQVDGTDSVKAAGEVALRSVEVAGGPLGQDRPTLAEATAAFDVALAGKTLTVTRAEVTSPLLAVSAAGDVVLPAGPTLPAGSLESTTRVDLAAVAAQLPHTIQLPEGLSLDRGTLAVTSKLVASNGTPGVQTELRLEDLAARQGDKRLALSQPVVVTAKAFHDEKGPRIDSFELTSSILAAKGSGDLETLDVELASDLAVAVQEIAQLVDLGGRTFRGKATVTVRLTSPEARSKRAEVALRVAGLEVGGIGPKPVALDEVKVNLGALARLTADNALEALRDLHVEMAVPAGGARFTAAGLTQAPEQVVPVSLQEGKLIVSADLAEALALGRSIATLDPELDVKGRADLHCDVVVADGLVKAEGLDLTLKNLDLRQGDKHLRQPEIRLTARAEAAPGTSTARVRGLVCQLPFGKLEVPSLDAPNWTVAPAGVAGEIQAQIDVHKALAALKDFVTLPEGTTVAAQATLAASLRGGKDTHEASLKAGLTDLKVVADGKPVADGETVALETAGAVAATLDRVELSTLKLTSAFAGLDAKATASELTSSRRLQAQGTLDLDFGRIGPLVNAFSDQSVEMSGRQSKPFQLNTSLAGKAWQDIVRETLASAGVRIERLKAMGLNFADLEVPLESKDGKLVVHVTSGFENGKLAVPATLDVSGETPVLTLPDDTVVLADVSMSDAVAERLLGPVSPLFKGAPVSAGEMGVIVRKFRLVLDDKPLESATIEADLKLHAVGLRKIPFLQPILDVMKLTPERFALPDQRISFALKEGRIHHSPISVGVAQFRLAVGGSVGLDKSLDMFVELPITPGMLGGKTELFGLLKGERLRIPIKGPKLDPSFVTDFVKDAVTGLVKVATEKMLKGGVEGVTKGVGAVGKGVTGVGKGIGGLLKGKDDDKDDEEPKKNDDKDDGEGKKPEGKDEPSTDAPKDDEGEKKGLKDRLKDKVPPLR